MADVKILFLHLLKLNCGAHTVYAHKETCSEEIIVVQLVQKRLKEVGVPQTGLPEQNKTRNPILQLIWGSTMYHIDYLPFNTRDLPDVYTQFRKAVESKSSIRSGFKLPQSLAPISTTLNEIGGWSTLLTLVQLGLDETKRMYFIGGESGALARVKEYLLINDKLKMYKETRNGYLLALYLHDTLLIIKKKYRRLISNTHHRSRGQE